LTRQVGKFTVEKFEHSLKRERRKIHIESAKGWKIHSYGETKFKCNIEGESLIKNAMGKVKTMPTPTPQESIRPTLFRSLRSHEEQIT